jgi:hypothetical protein
MLCLGRNGGALDRRSFMALDIYHGICTGLGAIEVRRAHYDFV